MKRVTILCITILLASSLPAAAQFSAAGAAGAGADYVQKKREQEAEALRQEREYQLRLEYLKLAQQEQAARLQRQQPQAKVAPSAQAGPVILGAGLQACQQWSNGALETTYVSQWLAGVLSGINVAALLTGDPQITEPQSDLAAWVYRYCASHGNETILQAFVAWLRK